jgi:catechol 2,3-dioxygenase-like lactoylglutathione lyase family enzyme
VQLPVRRGREAIAFYQEAFGATGVYRFQSDPVGPFGHHWEIGKPMPAWPRR